MKINANTCKRIHQHACGTDTCYKLKPGMYVLNPGISWITAPLLYMREGIVADQNEVDGIIQQGFTETIHDPERSVPCYEPGCGLPRVFSQHLAQAQDWDIPRLLGITE